MGGQVYGLREPDVRERERASGDFNGRCGGGGGGGAREPGWWWWCGLVTSSSSICDTHTLTHKHTQTKDGEEGETDSRQDSFTLLAQHHVPTTTTTTIATTSSILTKEYIYWGLNPIVALF